MRPVLASIEPESLAWRHLDIHSPPELPVVVDHLVNLTQSTTLDQWESRDHAAPEDVLLSICKYLETAWPHMTSQIQRQLQRTPLGKKNYSHNDKRVALPSDLIKD